MLLFRTKSVNRNFAMISRNSAGDRNEPTPDFSNVPSFTPKLSRKPQKGHPDLEVFLTGQEMF